MAGVYGSYDDPCHLWNDSIVHHYHFEVLALDVETLFCQGEFTGQDAVEAMEGHVLASASHLGTYLEQPFAEFVSMSVLAVARPSLHPTTGVRSPDLFRFSFADCHLQYHWLTTVLVMPVGPLP